MALIKVPTVEEEFKKNPELKESILDTLKDWHKKQPHLPPISDFELIQFLHSNYYRIESTKLTIDAYFTVRTHVPELFSRIDPLGIKEIRATMKLACCVPLPTATPEGYKVIYAKLIDPDPSHYVFLEIVKLAFMVFELYRYTVGTCPGFVVVTDMEGNGLGHLARISPVIVKKALYYVQEALPLRLKSLHYINAPPFADMFLNVAKPFIKKELMDLLQFHSTMKTLEDKLSIDILPNEVGGKAGSIDDLWSDYIKEIDAHRDWFIGQASRKVNETLRPGKAKNATDLFGVEGSFKKLDID